MFENLKAIAEAEGLPLAYLERIVALLKKAGMGVVSDPHTGPLHACVRELLDDLGPAIFNCVVVSARS